MKTPYLDKEIEYLESIKKAGEISFYSSKKLEEYKEAKQQLSLCGVTPRFSNKELSEMCNKMLFQIRGNFIEEHEQCEKQGHPDWQIAMSYFHKLNEG